MIKQLWKGAAMLTVLAALVIMSSCKQTVTVPKDTTPPAEVTELKTAAGNGKISLRWKNLADDDLYQVKITASPAAGSLANAVYLKANKGETMSFTAEGLSNGTPYTFTVQTLDKALNESTGVKTSTAVKPIDTADTTAPAEVTELKAETLQGAILLTWKEPADADLWGIEISSTQDIISSRTVELTPKKVLLLQRDRKALQLQTLQRV